MYTDWYHVTSLEENNNIVLVIPLEARVCPGTLTSAPLPELVTADTRKRYILPGTSAGIVMLFRVTVTSPISSKITKTPSGLL